jgi:uncharacterized membrane protein
MSFNLEQQAFQPLLNSTAPSFNSTILGTTSHAYALQATGREFQYADARSVRIFGATNDKFYVKFGQASTVTAASSDSVLVLGGQREVFAVTPNQTHIAFLTTSTAMTVNVTLGIGR